jgi:uncharacterized protein DUF6709
MWDDFISRQIRRTNRNLLLFGSVILLGLALLLAGGWRDTYNFLFGPFPIQNSELISIWNPDLPKHYFVKVEGDETFQTGMREVDANNHDKIRAELIALVVDKRLLLVKAPVDNQQVHFTGTLRAIPAEVANGVVHEWDRKHPDMKGAYLPFLLDATGFRKGDNLLVAAAGAGFGLLGLVLVGIPLRRKLQPENHPLLKQLARYGMLQDIQMRIDAEIRSEGGGEKFGHMQITTNWLLHAAAYKTNVMATRDVVWAYPKITKHYHNGIPTGKTYSAIIRDSQGQSLEISGKKDSVPKLLESLERRMPWVLVGFSKELEALWLKEKPKFFQLIEQRRAKLSPATR